ncbi:hypothetical protein [Crenalkalicoccus roseus]|uniref:hypothetical protein n=1 Tax=Crenalkalicoccus roseus TaxID=1485588 RepID=UPI001080FE54|nr:hypothetical protein [Crenalkalicoccus roseus]
MRRRTLLRLSLILLPLPALAQGAPPAAAPPKRRRLSTLNFEEMTPQQRRMVQRRLAGEGKPPLPPEEARRAWNGMTRQQRADATRRQDAPRRRDAAVAEPAPR